MLMVISSNDYTFKTIPPPPAPLMEGETKDVNWDNYISIDMIRQHTKTDDMPGVTDAQLRLYRAAAVEAAEFYTGMVLSKQKVITEVVSMPKHRPGKEYFTIRLQNPSSDGVIYLYGDNRNPEAIKVTPNTRKVRIQSRYYIPDLSNCCNPCSKPTNDLHFVYRSGFSCPEQVPAGVLLGILQFVAWVIQHPGDEVLSMRNTLSTRGGAIIGTNNIALVSGALESWRQYDPEAI
jgi:hypothetical protein